MSAAVQELRALLEERDIGRFLAAYERVEIEHRSIELTGVTQRIFPTVLREALLRGNLASEDVVKLWSLVRTGRLVLVENDLLEGINAVLNGAWRDVKGPETTLPDKLLTYSSDPEPAPRPRARPTAEPSGTENAIPMRRIVIGSAFTLGSARLSDSLAFKKNICASSQEREFIKAVRQYFPNLSAYPNVPLKNFMDVDGLIGRLSDRHRNYAWAAQVDLLLCTDDEDPVAGFELDSALHDTDEVRERDHLKDELFSMAVIPLLRIRADDTANVRAEDFYDLLVAESETLDQLRPRRLRPRRNHDTLVPAEVAVRSTATRAHL
jgi:hypothetical protein